jgi:CRISPR-associated endonuclease/helicase Cas3
MARMEPLEPTAGAQQPGPRAGVARAAKPSADLPWAHSHAEAADPADRSHGLVDHLQAVGLLASDFAVGFGPDWARLAGLWHDLGKFRPGFQAYVRRDGDAHIEGRLPPSSEKTHSAAGALHAFEQFRQRWGMGGEQAARALAYAIAGHHAGLANWVAEEGAGGLETRLLGTGAPASRLEYDEAAAAAQHHAHDLLQLPADFDLRQAVAGIPGARGGNPLALSLWIRMLFSALVDADFLDTEAFMDRRRAQARHAYAPIDDYKVRLDAHLEALASKVAQQGRSVDAVMAARARVLDQCRRKARQAPGVFTLTVPTGGGKTLSSLAFALAHAAAHGHQRVIYAIPYTSIIEQTADVFAGIFGSDAVVEHHSQADGADNGSTETQRSRLACENWDAPLIVTTNVQLFESLFAARTSRCRKLHRLAGSVIVLDEAQLLPPDFLQPILDVLNVLVSHYGVTLLLCTATQPVLTDTPRFDSRRSLRGLPAPTPIIDDEAALYAALRRTRVHWPADLSTPEPLDGVADRAAAHEAVLAIVNTRQDAADLLRLLDARCSEPALHLSAAMCGQHRADVIAQVRARLDGRQAGTDLRPLRVVSTQLVEAGVDIDFPVVFRALAGLDSIAQSAGRCNREGRLAHGALGQVHVFVRDIPKPLTHVRLGAQATRSVRASAAGTDAELTPADFSNYFRLYHGDIDTDRHRIVELLSRDKASFAFQFRTAAERFRLVDDADQASIVVPYGPAGQEGSDIALAVRALENKLSDRWLLRKLQRYTVSVRLCVLRPWQARGDVLEVLPGLYVLKDERRYDARLGLIPEGAALDVASFVA